MQEHSTIPLGLCQCGCGQQTKPISQTNKKRGHIKGQPAKCIKSHNVRPILAEPAPIPLCACGCGQPLTIYSYAHKDRKYLRGHFARARQNFNPVGEPVNNRFWRQVDKSDDCWLWIGHRNEKGYGEFAVKDGKWKHVRAHRFAWTLTNGPIPKGMFICHKCDNPSCVNPEHLFIGSPAENSQDMKDKGRSSHSSRDPQTYPLGESVGNAKLNTTKVITIRALYQVGVRQSDLARQFHISPVTVHNVIKRHTWRHI